MDPTAPKEENQSLPGEENQQPSPIQTGQFVVSSEPGTGQAQTTNQPPDILQQVSQPTGAPDLQSSLNETVVAATGTNLAGEPPPAPSLSTNSPTQVDPNISAASNQQQQPDPTPFVPPGPANPPATGVPTPEAQPQQASSGEGGSKMNKIKIVVIVVATVILIAIVAAVVWFFVLNKKASPDTSTTDQMQIEEPAVPSPQVESGFGDIPEATQEATESAEQPVEENPQP